MILKSRNDQDHHRCPEQVDHILYVVLMGLVDMEVDLQHYSHYRRKNDHG